MKVCAVIVTHNAMKWIERSLSSLFASTCVPEVIVVDNASEDGTADFLMTFGSRVRVLHMDRNTGFTFAAQKGIDLALSLKADAVLLMHHDVWVEPDAIAILLKSCTDDSLLAPVYLTGAGHRCETSFRSRTLRHSRKLRKYLSADKYSSRKIKVRNLPSACWFIPSSLLSEVGPLNTLLFNSGEENDYIARMKYHSKSAYVVTGARIYHDRDSYGDRTLYDKSRIYNELLLIGCDPNKGRFRRAVAKTSMFGRTVANTVHFRVNLIKVLKKDYSRVRKIRQLLKEKRKYFRNPSEGI